jgi:hypothetical protein
MGWDRTKWDDQQDQWNETVLVLVSANDVHEWQTRMGYISH